MYILDTSEFGLTFESTSGLRSNFGLPKWKMTKTKRHYLIQKRSTPSPLSRDSLAVLFRVNTRTPNIKYKWFRLIWGLSLDWHFQVSAWNIYFVLKRTSSVKLWIVNLFVYVDKMKKKTFPDSTWNLYPQFNHESWCSSVNSKQNRWKCLLLKIKTTHEVWFHVFYIGVCYLPFSNSEDWSLIAIRS